MATAASPAEQRVLLGNVSWSTYLTLVENTDSPRGRMTYDQGMLEIMSPSTLHETIKTLLGRMVETFTFELGIEIRSLGATTFKRVDLEKGLEADECYYVQGAAAVQGVEEIDLALHPPPDLAIEIDITRSSSIKLRVYSSLQVREVWRYDGELIRVLVLRDRNYVEFTESEVLAQFPIAEANRLLEQRQSMGETELIRRFHSWVRQHVAESSP